MDIDGQAKADHHAALFSAGCYDALVAQYQFPLTVYMLGQPRGLANRQEALAFFQSFHAALNASGLTDLSARVVAIDLPIAPRRRTWTEWTASGPGRAPAQVATTVCYARMGGTGMVTEMLEFTRLDLPMFAAA